jgi:DtxR family Mn-dependent transcriptional regulator
MTSIQPSPTRSPDRRAPVEDRFRAPGPAGYCEAIFLLAENGDAARQASVARRLRVTQTTVSQTVRRLAATGLVEVRGSLLTLTPAGETCARPGIRRFRLVECLLAEVFRVPWEQVHDEAVRWRHVLSDRTEPAVDRLLGWPVTCPHGNPIPPGHGGAAPVDVSGRLADLRVGERFQVTRIAESVERQRDLLGYLALSGLRTGQRGEVLGCSADAVTVRTAGPVIGIAERTAARIGVARLAETA